MAESKTKATTEKTAKDGAKQILVQLNLPKEGAKQLAEKELQDLIEKREKIRAMLKEKRTKFSAAEIELLYRQDAAITMHADTLAERLRIWREV
jgi:hypothetical protein